MEPHGRDANTSTSFAANRRGLRMKLNTMPSVRLRATIAIDVDAADYLEAAEHQKKLESHLTAVRADYPEASIAVIERRPQSVVGPVRPRGMKVRTGRLNTYV
jgi:hypothetical protein